MLFRSTVFTHLDELEVEDALFAAHRVRVAAWGAEMRMPDSSVIRVTAALGKALQTLVLAYQSVQAKDLDAALKSAQRAYTLADDTDALNEGVTVYTDRVRSYAHGLANDIRSYAEE